MKDLMKKMDKYSESIETQERKRGRLQGRLEAGLDDLKRDGMEDEEAAELFVKNETKEVDELESVLHADVEEFENVYAQHLE